ncbi:MAG: Ig-like domain-containing protein [Gemmatimonadetes bacterium]|nr:Ig-like domain-containing protein [Gemmatimonadota bacterium]
MTSKGRSIAAARLPSVRATLALGLAIALAAIGSSGCDWAERTEPLVPTSIVVTPSSATLRSFGETVQLSALVHDQNGQVITGAAITWATSDAAVATASASGLVTATDNGHATVTASAGAATGAATVVVAQEVARVVVTPAADTLVALGDTVRLTAGAQDANGHSVSGKAFSWQSSDTIVAKVDAAGLVAAVRNGMARITATTGFVVGTAIVSVRQRADSIIVSPATDTIFLGDSLPLSAVAFDAKGHMVERPILEWKSWDTLVAVVDATGLVEGTGEGTATVAATAGDVQGTAKITVENPDRAVLVALYEATDGPNWYRSDNWLTDAPLGDWYGVDVNEARRVSCLGYCDNLVRSSGGLGVGSGSIPGELGDLDALEHLSLSMSRSGPIPAELDIEGPV